MLPVDYLDECLKTFLSQSLLGAYVIIPHYLNIQLFFFHFLHILINSEMLMCLLITEQQTIKSFHNRIKGF